MSGAHESQTRNAGHKQALGQVPATGCLTGLLTWNLRSLMPSSFCLKSSAKRLFSCRDAS